MNRSKISRADRGWQVLTDPNARASWLKALHDPQSGQRIPIEGPVERQLIGFGEAINRHLVSCVLFGRPPPGISELLSLGIDAGRSDLPREDFAAALWRAASDATFRHECFGDARATLSREGYVLDDEELGKFRWYDHEKLAQLRAFMEERITEHFGDAILAAAPPVAPAGDALDRQLLALYEDHTRQVVDLRAAGVSLLADSDNYSPGEFDPGPPPPDFPSFLAILQLLRQWDLDINAVLRGSGYSLGRVMMVVRALQRQGVSLPPWKPLLDDDKENLEQWFALAMAGSRPTMDEHFHQSPCDTNAVISRVLHIAQHNWLRNRPILVLGDDDGISIALARCTEAEVHVIDIDTRVLGFLQTVAQAQGLNLHVHQHDLRTPLPDDLVGRFALVSADPPQSAAGQSFFLERAIDALVCEPGYRIYSSITPMWMGGNAYHSVLAHMIRRGFASREVLKSDMTFSVRPPPGQAGHELLTDAIGGMLNMACDVHVFQRMVMD